MLRLLDYPSLFREVSQRKGLVLPSIENLSRLDAVALADFWAQALQAEASLEAGAQSASQAGGAGAPMVPADGAAPAAPAASLANLEGEADDALAPAELLAESPDLEAEDIEFLRHALSSGPLPTDLQHSEFRNRHERYERGYPYLAASGRHTSLMARHLTPELYDELKEQRTATGFTLDDVIRPGVRLPDHPIGALAGESECYETFPALFDMIVHDWHGWHRSQSPSHKGDTDASKLEMPEGYADAAAACLRGIRIDVRRNFVGWMFTPSLNMTGRAGVERASQV